MLKGTIFICSEELIARTIIPRTLNGQHSLAFCSYLVYKIATGDGMSGSQPEFLGQKLFAKSDFLYVAVQIKK